jgi:hypothetical protein
MEEAKRIKAYFPYRIVFICEKDGVFEILCGKTKAKGMNALSKGWNVFILK